MRQGSNDNESTMKPMDDLLLEKHLGCCPWRNSVGGGNQELHLRNASENGDVLEEQSKEVLKKPIEMTESNMYF